MPVSHLRLKLLPCCTIVLKLDQIEPASHHQTRFYQFDSDFARVVS
jgi:hypothetical protein